jgi:hypothetical protein
MKSNGCLINKKDIAAKSQHLSIFEAAFYMNTYITGGF